MFKLRFLESRRKTITYLAIMMAIVLIFTAILIAIDGDAYYTCCSDDLLQYFKMNEDFALKLKTGKLSFYNYNNYLGASFYSDTYYVPLDLFTIVSFLLSFVMNYEIAFGLTEMFKLFLGTLMFAYFLHLRKCSNKAIFVTSLLYFVCGYNSIIMAFSAFFSLVFYYPFTAVCIEKYKQGNKLLLPICSALLVFYNYYLGACTMVFMGMWFILSYFLDNKLQTVKDEILKVNPNAKHVTLLAILIYLKRGFVQGFICAMYMVIGILIACIILLPSASFILADSYQRHENFYKWSFNAKAGYTQTTALKMYARVLGNLFTPTYSTDFYGFINDYITDHISLYITITGLVIMLYIFKLKDRESRIYKIALLFEVLFLAIPVFYMLFSLNGAPYTRWVGMLNILNLLIVGHVITQTDFKFNLLSIKSLITNGLLVVVIVLVLNYYLGKVYNVNLAIINNQLVLNEKYEDMKYDVVMMFVALGIILVLSIGSIGKIQKKFNIMPYVLAVELVIGFLWMFEPKAENYGTLSFSDSKERLNGFMSSNLETPYDGDFSRTHIKTYITDDFIYSTSYTRTNLYLSDLRIFHSFYDCSANEMSKLYYDNGSYSAETRNSKEVMNGYSMFLQQALANRYVVVDNDEYPFYFPEEYYDFVAEDGEFLAYENKNYAPFMIYDKTINHDKFSEVNEIIKQQYILNYCYTGDEKTSIPVGTPAINGTYKTCYEGIKDEDYNTVQYKILNQTSIPSKGVMHFYFSGYDGARTMSFQDVWLEFEDGHRESALSGYAFYDEIPTSLWIYMNGDYTSLDSYEKDLIVEFTDYTEYEKYLTRMQNYKDLSLKMDGSKLKLSFERENKNNDIIVALPIAYNECWKLDKNYKTIKVNGGLLGIIVPKGEQNISINLEFIPRRLNVSALASMLGIAIYGVVVIANGRRRKEYEEDCNYCSLLQ